MADNLTFSVRSNANRAARRILASGGAPAPDYEVRTRDDGLFEIVWLTDNPGLSMAAWPAATPEEEARGQAKRDARAAAALATEYGPERLPGTEAIEAEITAAAMTPDQALDSVYGEGTAADMARLGTEPAVESKAKRSPRKARKTDSLPPAERSPRGPRAKFAGAPAAEPGAMPEKPVLTAAGFTASYQKRIDSLAELAAAGDWATVEAFEVKGKNTYSKIVARYRDQLLAAHAAQSTKAGQ